MKFSLIHPLLTYRCFTKVMSAAASRHCGGKLLFFHEGGYSAVYVPFCGLAVMEQLSGFKTEVVDALLEDTAVGYQDLQPWQDTFISQVEQGPLELLRRKMRGEKGQQ
eukprot:GHUV01051969.1.p2 GENE.GHUV01051969.1~~GHUV01051969.1.p2  ORF type:complete len:108 (-),score=34.53 GHUV01051969.1:285-608(-)